MYCIYLGYIKVFVYLNQYMHQMILLGRPDDLLSSSSGKDEDTEQK